MATAHVTAEILAAYASGALSEGMSLLVAGHLTFCPECRARVARLEALGGALLREGAEVAPSEACRARALARLEAEAAQPPLPQPPAAPGAAREPGPPLPAPLRDRLGPAACAIRWRFLLPGLAEHRLAGFPGEAVRLFRARPGRRIPRHTHEGQEAMLILAGRLRDGERVFAQGDVSLADAGHDHSPESAGPETCVCLAVLAGPLRFKGRFGRVLDRLTR